ncbi:sensor histidine kinase [Lysobacter niastensis]|uniref:sensor histidine kinase n=1 Tax=Lysobacter niastensis TaxID=380629 RepID=UPI001E4C6980|nr:ATP-binding protein [Lysobacter niastensis]
MSRFAARHDFIDDTEADQALRRELYFFTLYRLLEAALLALLVFGPVDGLIEAPRHPALGKMVASLYLVVAGVLFITGRRGDLRVQALVGVACDIAFGMLAMHALPAVGTGIALMLLFNVASAALLLPLSLGLGAAITAAMAVVGEFAWTDLAGEPAGRTAAEPVMFTLGFVAIALLTNFVGRQMRASHDLAEKRGQEAAGLAEVSELIIRRMRTGVLLVDGDNRLRLANEAAMLLLGDAGDAPIDGHRNILLAAPELARRLAKWRAEGLPDETPLQLVPDMPEVVPRFTRMSAGSDQTLIFLDDTSLVSRRAESMTLATLGRFSASLAHEIRNPLAAINYAVQLLEESHDLPTADRRLLEIIRQQGVRMNGIVENVLGLARREPAQPEHVELIGFAHQFIDEYVAGHPLEHDSLRASGTLPRVSALADPRQLHQVLTALVHNALTYGRMPGQPAKVTLHVSVDIGNAPVIEVMDRGPGIPESVATQLFRPFFTTSGHGTGLGLYIARELCRANQSTLDYVPLPGGGGCFRIRLPGVNALLTA